MRVDVDKQPVLFGSLEQLDLRVPVLSLGVEDNCARRGFCDCFADNFMMGEGDKFFAPSKTFVDAHNCRFGLAQTDSVTDY